MFFSWHMSADLSTKCGKWRSLVRVSF